MKSFVLDKNDFEIIFKVGVEEMVYKTDINSFVEETGVTIQNINFPVTGYYIRLSDISKTFACGNIIENLFVEIKKNGVENSLLVMDFNGIEELSDNFYESYTKILLETSHKIITINMSVSLSNEFSNFIEKSIVEVEE